LIPAERENYIFDKLKQNGSVKVEEVAEELNVSLMTVRRDLDRLQERGLLYRSHGGAVQRELYPLEQAYDIKKISNIETKEKIAAKALTLVNDGDTIFLDAGTTTFELSRLLKAKKDITVITNDLKIALELYQNNIQTYVVGGKVQQETGSIIGTKAEEFIDSIRVNISFLGTSAVSNEGYLSTPTFEKSVLKRKVVKCASYAVLLADSSKFNKESFVNIVSITDINAVVTDKQFKDQELKQLEENNVNIVMI
jgi:DeoR/GlpR family transcriptional regulator of sugar metabolism